jgi:hypothetical protein
LTVGKPSQVDGAAAIALRPIVADDRSFLLAVYANTRELELAAVPWDAGQKAAFVRMQFDAQHAYYQLPRRHGPEPFGWKTCQPANRDVFSPRWCELSLGIGSWELGVGRFR